ncbi:MAG: hypothetical protein AAGA42_01070 [Actinomycetota bacterium]
MWDPAERTADVGLNASPESTQHRLDAAAERAHAQAEAAARLRRSTDMMRQLGARDVNELLGALSDAEARATAAEAELARLRSLPELKVGQRVRQPVAALARRRSDVAPSPAPDSTPDRLPTTAPVAALILVRNRRRALPDVVAWLRAGGIERIGIVDNATTDPVTLRAIEESGLVVHRLEEDLGDAAPWAAGALADLLLDGPVLLVGDDTVATDDAPDEMIDRLVAALDDADAVDLVAAQANGRTAWMRLIRRGAGPSGRRRVVTEPWVALASLDLDADEPEERYARLHEADRPRTGPPAE